ncbi:MAG: BamA/TamA family outer membrane protein [Bacteroidales bacterium]|nr:BamA/TamA family outer membrane protein [Bacteroidales bacterium]MDD3891083.1 BamA/TamA family outer membrane protein [Bacteroidales bacterium]
MIRKPSISILFLLFATLQGIGQRVTGEIVFSDVENAQKCFNRFEANDTLSIYSAFNKCLSKTLSSGFLEARIDSVSIGSNHALAYGYMGEKYMFERFEIDSISAKIYSNAGVSLKAIRRGELSPTTFNSISQKTIKFLENNGYPFAYVDFTDVEIKSNKANITSSITLGPKIILDTIYIKGDARVQRRFIETYLRFSKGKPYSHKMAAKLDKSINQLGFIATIKPSEVEFIPGKARLFTYLTNKSASHFSGVVGFSSGEEGKKGLQLTGDVNLRLVNGFKRGETNMLKWQAMGEGFQRLKVATAWPYVFGSDISISGSFNLLRRDTSYMNINPQLGVNFRLSSGSRVGLGVNYKSSVTSAPASSQISGYSTMLYNVSFASDQEGNELFPVSQFYHSTTIGVGKRRVDNSQLSTENRTRTLGEVSVMLESYVPLLFNNFILHNKLQATAMEFIGSKVDIMENEAFLIGGASTLRGFNDESILARHYGIATVELQYRMQNTLNVFIFSDFGYASYSSLGIWDKAYPWSAGAGVQILTRGGIFNLTYALGKGFGQELSIKNAKVHVGYLTTF